MLDQLLNPDTGLMIWVIVTFLCLVAILKLFAWGPLLGASEAREYGLVHHVVDSAGLMQRAREIAGAIADASPTAIRAVLTFVRDAQGKSWEEAGNLARQMRTQVFHSADFQEGIRAFQEKRQPQWPSYATQHLGDESKRAHFEGHKVLYFCSGRV